MPRPNDNFPAGPAHGVFSRVLSVEPGQQNGNSKASGMGGWFKASRHPEMPELVRSSRTAFILAYSLAFRARWNPAAFNPFKLMMGEAVCDYANWGLTEQEFRNARDKLKEWNYATFRATNKGTIGKLVNTRLFSVLAVESNEQKNGQSNGQTTSRATTYQEPKSKRAKEGKGKGRLSSAVFSPADLESQSQKLGEQLELDPDAVDAFVAQHHRDKWTVPNKRTGKRERIRYLKPCLEKFCDRFERNRRGER